MDDKEIRKEFINDLKTILDLLIKWSFQVDGMSEWVDTEIENKTSSMQILRSEMQKFTGENIKPEEIKTFKAYIDVMNYHSANVAFSYLAEALSDFAGTISEHCRSAKTMSEEDKAMAYMSGLQSWARNEPIEIGGLE